MVTRSNLYEPKTPLPSPGISGVDAMILGDHHHALPQLVFSAGGVVTVSTQAGRWAAPLGFGAWVPAGVDHAAHIVGPAPGASLLLQAQRPSSGSLSCHVVRLSPLLQALLATTVSPPPQDAAPHRDELVRRLIIAELETAPTAALGVPIAPDPALARLCRAFLDRPDPNANLDLWAGKLGVDRRTVTRRFRHGVGLSFANWRRQACLALALPRLAAGESPTSVAAQMGYAGAAELRAMIAKTLANA